MPHRIIEFAENMVAIVQWTWILSVGFVASQLNYMDDLHQIVVTIASMSLGAVAAFFIKRWLNGYFKHKK